MGHHRGIIHTLTWCLLSLPVCFTALLSPDQKAPLFARGSGGLILNPPFESDQRAVASPPAATNVINDDGVQRQETASFKVVDGELVRVVEGFYSYKSPEGIPVSVNYVADENGYRAGFRLGRAALEGSGPSIRPLGPSGPPEPLERLGSLGPTRPLGPSGPLGPPGGTTYLPPKTTADRSYLPPH